MKPQFPAVVALATLIGGGAALAAAVDPNPPVAPAAAPAIAAPATPAPATSVTPAVPPPGQSQQAEAAKAAEARAQAEMADRAAFLDAHIAALHAGLALTPDQEALWPALDKAIRGVAEMRQDLRRAWREGRMGQTNPSDDPIGMLKRTSDRMMQRGQALSALADASAPLYKTLSDDQKRRLPRLLHDLAPERGPVGRMMSMLGQDHGRDDGGPGGMWERRHRGMWRSGGLDHPGMPGQMAKQDRDGWDGFRRGPDRHGWSDARTGDGPDRRHDGTADRRPNPDDESDGFND